MPIPKVPEGFAIGPAEADRKIMVFMAHTCGDCSAAWPNMYPFFKNNTDWLRVEFHFVPLPYDPNGFLMQQGGRYIQDKYPHKFLDLVTWMFENNYKYGTGTHQTQAELRKMLCQDIETVTGVDASEVADNLDNVYEDIRISAQYAAFKGVFWTPSFFLNGVIDWDMNILKTEEDWFNYFKNFN